MRRPATILSVTVLVGLLGTPPVLAAEAAPVPDGYEAPRSSVDVFTAWSAPHSSVQLFRTEPEQADAEALEETLDADRSGGDTVVQLSDRFLFDFGSAELRPTAAASLDTLVALLAQSDAPVAVTGHTDSVGSDESNQTLSEDRAAAVGEYLVAQDIPADRIATAGAGESEPIADNTTAEGRDNPEGRQQNRRVEVRYADG